MRYALPIAAAAILAPISVVPYVLVPLFVLSVSAAMAIGYRAGSFDVQEGFGWFPLSKQLDRLFSAPVRASAWLLCLALCMLILVVRWVLRVRVEQASAVRMTLGGDRPMSVYRKLGGP